MKSTLLLLTMTVPLMVNAAIINIGDVSYDNTQNYMTDTETGTQYSSLDATLGLSYDDLVLSMQSGGAWDGWSFATSKESDDLINALLQSISPCTGAVDAPTSCGNISGWTDGELGASFTPESDIWFYVSTYNTPNIPIELDVGYVELQSTNGLTRDYDDWLTSADAAAFTESNSQTPVGYLLYKNSDVSVYPVPAPPVSTLFALFSLFLVVRRFQIRNK